MSPNAADETSYLWENIPRELWNEARRQALTAGPGGKAKSMKAILLDLLEAWVLARVGAAKP